MGGSKFGMWVRKNGENIKNLESSFERDRGSRKRERGGKGTTIFGRYKTFLRDVKTSRIIQESRVWKEGKKTYAQGEKLKFQRRTWFKGLKSFGGADGLVRRGKGGEF